MKEFKSIEAKLNQIDEYDKMAKEAGCKIEVRDKDIPIVHNYYKKGELLVSVKAFSEVPKS